LKEIIMTNLEIVSKHVESAMHGEPPQSFKDPAAAELIRTMGQMTTREIYQLGAKTIQLVLARQLAAAHAEREIRLMSDKSRPMCWHCGHTSQGNSTVFFAYNMIRLPTGKRVSRPSIY
jgi:hypothetical protein